MKQVTINISFNIDEKDYNSKEFQEFLESVKNGSMAKELEYPIGEHESVKKVIIKTNTK